MNEICLPGGVRLFWRYRDPAKFVDFSRSRNWDHERRVGPQGTPTFVLGLFSLCVEFVTGDEYF